ncbi:MAG: DUF2723 domain-containing protein, partial [Verrucomicrobia bacterium]|nr:DUF2723 domain-containing protein [Verrucomicrobiota bacterium]
MSKSKNRPGRNQPPSNPSAARPAPKPAPVPVPAPAPAEPTAPLFRRIDWLAFFLTTILVMVGYVLTLAPNVTLEDSGELSVGSYYAGIPHPPGYPVWALYTWVFANFMPIGNIAWRVGFASGLAGAVACGIIALMVSRGSSLMIEGLADLKNVDRKLENALCLVSGLVSGLLMGFNGYFWSQAVIVEVYTLSVLSLVIVMACMMRWAYAPNRYRYLYWAAFVFGICFTNHQTLIVAAMGIQVLVAGVNPKLGRDAFFMNSVIFVGALLLNRMGMLANLSANGPLFVVFICIGLMSIAAFMYLWAQTRQVLTEWKVGVICTLLWVAGAAFYFWMPIASMSTPPLNWGYPRTVEGFFHALTRGQYEKANPSNLFNDPMRFFGQLWMYADGVIEEFSLPYIALGLLPFVFVFYWKMKREELKVLLLSSGGYVVLCLCIVARYFFAQKAPASQFFWSNLPQLAGMVVGLVFLWIMLTPTVIKSHAQRRESAWIAGLTGIYLGLALLLLILLNPSPDRQSKELNKVFFTSSHVMVAMGIGLGLSMLGAALSLFYDRIRKWFAIGAIICSAMALFVVAVTYFGDEHARDTLTGVLFELGPTAEPTARFADVLSLVLAAVTAGALLLCRARAPFKVLLLVFALLPVRSISSHWWDNEQRGHLFGYWFGHDMFTPPFKDKAGKPLYPEMDRDTVLFGGTDPGRFNPTYMIYNESFIPERCRQDEDPKFDRRDVYLITQNALADATYLMYIRAHYNRGAQKDPPFFTEFFHTQLLRPLDTLFGGIGDAIEKDRRSGSSRVKPADLLDAKGLAAKLAAADTNSLGGFIVAALAPRTKELLKNGDEAALRSALAKDLDALLERELKDRKNPDFSATPRPLYTPERFASVPLSPRTLRFVKENPQSHTRIRLNRQLLEEAFQKEIAKSPGGVYPDLEIKTPTSEDSQQAFQEYIQDAQRRKQHDDTLPNEPRQLKQGEDVRIDNGRVQVSGQIAVMSINGLLTKVLFDKNPAHEFYVEESFPLDWMFPYLTPFGVIMKINRQPLAELTDDICQRDHEFWSQFSSRLTGNWLTYDTPVKDVCEFAERVYLNRDLRNSK